MHDDVQRHADDDVDAAAGLTGYDRAMAGPIGMAVLRGIKTVTCPHCGTRQARGRHAVAGKITCKACKKVFELPAEPKPRKR